MNFPLFLLLFPQSFSRETLQEKEQCQINHWWNYCKVVRKPFGERSTGWSTVKTAWYIGWVSAEISLVFGTQYFHSWTAGWKRIYLYEICKPLKIERHCMLLWRSGIKCRMILDNWENGLKCGMQFNGSKCKAPNSGWTDEVPKSMMGSN